MSYEAHAMDVSRAEEQAAIADSLIADDETVRPLSSFNIDSAADERLAEEWPNEQADFIEEMPQSVLTDEELDALAAERSGQQGNDQREQAESEPQEAEREWTAAEISEGVQTLGQEVERLGLNDPAA